MAAAKFNSKCTTCETAVPKGSGDVRKGATGKWVVTCDSHKPVRMTPNPRTPQGFASERRVRMTDGGRVVFVSVDNVHDAMKDGFRRA